jgi:hypothetical protein
VRYFLNRAAQGLRGVIRRQDHDDFLLVQHPSLL